MKKANRERAKADAFIQKLVDDLHDVAEHDHGRTTHTHAWASFPHNHFLRAVCGRDECQGCATHNIHSAPFRRGDGYTPVPTR